MQCFWEEEPCSAFYIIGADGREKSSQALEGKIFPVKQ